MSDKAGFSDEWQLFQEHWADGEPTVLASLTNCVRLGDLLVARGNELWNIEVKRNPKNFRADQMGRLRELKRQLNEDPRIDGADGPSWILESEIPLVSHWSGAEPHLRRAIASGVAVWVPAPGIAVRFNHWQGAALAGRDTWEQNLKIEQEAAAALIGPESDRILVHSHEYPYLGRWGAPLSILPVSPDLVAMILSGDIHFTTEIRVAAMLDALVGEGARVENLITGPADEPIPEELMRWRHGSTWGIVQRQALEQIGIELLDLRTWARASVSAPRPAAAPGRWQAYVCFANEADVWA